MHPHVLNKKSWIYFVKIRPKGTLNNLHSDRRQTGLQLQCDIRNILNFKLMVPCIVIQC